MYKAIIVDDEKKICSLILELGDWEVLGIQVAAVCHDGEEGLRSIQEHRPDLVLTDVRMPVYDGLELIKRISELGIPAAFVIISGYKYFEYAYSAFKYGVVDYLLKPIDKEQLNEVLRKIVDMLEARQHVANTEDKLKRLNENIEQSRRKKMFEDLFSGKSFPVTPEALEEAYRKRFSRPVWQVFFLRTNRNLEQEGNLLLAQKIGEAAGQIFKGADKLCAEPVLGGIGGILNFDPGHEEKMKNRMEALLMDAKELAEMFGNTQVTIGLGGVVYSLAELPESARLAIASERAKVTLGANRVLEIEKASFSAMRADMILTEKRRKEFSALLEAMNPEGISEWFSHLSQAPDKWKSPRPEEFFAIRDQLLQVLETYTLSHDYTRQFLNFQEALLEESEYFGGMEEFLKVLEQHIRLFLTSLRSDLSSREKLPIRLAKSYISEHYNEPITLEEVAEKVALSPAYFSTNFKKFEKRTFTDYLTSVRMSAAKELLSTTRKTNYEIALSAGYTDDKYFCKVFKKEVGIRPGEYRKLYFKGERA